jgi:SAM-dependent methyltransferase
MATGADRTPYVDTFFRELSPAWLSYVAALRGVAPPPVDRPFAYLELGCGYGQSVTVNAAAYPHAEFHACDIDPAHIAAARRYADAIGVRNVRFHEASFGDLLDADLPAFDYVALHGTYSWVDADARAAIRRVIDRKLEPGGLVYASYNCYPGWATEVPLRKLFAELTGTGGDAIRDRIRAASRTMRSLADAGFAYFTAHPEAVAATASYSRREPEYLAHELLGDAWDALFSVDVADEMREAHLSYVGSATLVDNHPGLLVNESAARAIAELASDRQRQLAEDFAMNRAFRRDVFVRGAPDHEAHLANVVIGRLGDPDALDTRVRVPRGIVTFRADFVHALARLMRAGSMPIGEIVRTLSTATHDAREIVRNLTYLVAAGELTPFARAHAARTAGEPDPIVEKVLAWMDTHHVPRAVPNAVLGSGIELRPGDSNARERVLDFSRRYR